MLYLTMYPSIYNINQLINLTFADLFSPASGSSPLPLPDHFLYTRDLVSYRVSETWRDWRVSGGSGNRVWWTICSHLMIGIQNNINVTPHNLLKPMVLIYAYICCALNYISIILLLSTGLIKKQQTVQNAAARNVVHADRYTSAKLKYCNTGLLKYFIFYLQNIFLLYVSSASG